MSSFFEKPLAIFLFFIPVGLILSVLDPSAPIGNIDWFGGWSLLVYPIFFVYGFILYSNEKFQKTIEKYGKLSLILALATFIPVMILFVQHMTGEAFFFGTIDYVILMFLRTFNSWCFILAFLGLSMRYLTKSTPKLRYLNEGSLPIYMLHQTVIVLIGFSIASWNIPILPKWIFLLAASFASIFLLYEFLIRRIGISRFIFGLKPK